ncbi:OmpH family outer membrane protein [Amaricoccus macauensis]|uniref:OmpH family outer membrane protein n=1 Tax=Amaricoccus macauensis TaxID=57001 RepID=UPI003C7BC2A5
MAPGVSDLSKICRALGFAAWIALVPGVSAAQSQDTPAVAPFLFINQERILVDSEAGKALLAQEETERTRLVAEARSIDAAFEAEERELTEKRKTLPAAEFAELAEDFDARVVAARQRQDERSDALAQELERARRQFFAEVAPLLVQFMDRHGASAIFDENSVLLADQRLNITDAVIEEIDAAYSDALSGEGTPDNQNDGETEP